MSQMTASPTSVPSAAPAHVRTGPILVAVGATDARSVLRAAQLLASGAPDDVLAVSVIEAWPVYAFGMEPMLVPAGFDEDRRAALTRQLASQVQEVAGGDPAWRTSVAYGDPPYALTDLARTLRSPLIVMGIGRHRPLDRILGAETTLRTIRRAPCPVLAVHPAFDAPFRDVVVATDFSPASARAAEILAPLLGAKATLHLVHVWEPAATEDTRLNASDAAYARALPDRFRRVTEILSLPAGVSVKPVTREGKTAERILDYAAAHHADLIVAGRHGLNAFKRLLVGSVTTALLRGADRSVLVTPEPPFADTERLRRLLTGTSRSTDPAEWAVQLAAFSHRNRGRRTVVEVDDLAFGAQVVESGYVLRGVAYDRDELRVELALGDPDHEARQVTRAMGMVDSVTVAADPSGNDLGLRISHGGGQTILTFSSE